MPGMFIGSVAKLDPLDPEMDTISPQPLPHESFITLDWTLPLSAEGQRLLFTRVRKTFDRVTGMVPTHLKKKIQVDNGRVASDEELGRFVFPDFWEHSVENDSRGVWPVDL